MGPRARDERGTKRAGVLIIDEYQDVVTSGHGVALGDDRFLAKGREANAITIVATQSLTSLKNSLRNDHAAGELFQNFRTRIAGSSDDPATVRNFQEITGQVDREMVSRSVSETSQDAKPNLVTGGYAAGRATNVSEGLTTSMQKEFCVTAAQFGSLAMFETFARVFDGSKATFHRLYLKPFFLKDKSTRHDTLLAALKRSHSSCTCGGLD